MGAVLVYNCMKNVITYWSINRWKTQYIFRQFAGCVVFFFCLFDCVGLEKSVCLLLRNVKSAYYRFTSLTYAKKNARPNHEHTVRNVNR